MFQKLGLLPLPAHRPGYMHSHAYLPNAFLLNPETIRCVVAFWDKDSVGRIGYLDTLVANPLHAIGYSEAPTLDIGDPGSFDDNGVSPLCIVREGDALRLYYAGWQLSDKVRYFLFTGLAVSRDWGTSFQRVQRTPVLERRDDKLTLRTGGYVFRNGARWSMIYGAGSGTIMGCGKVLPTYDLRYIESDDGIHWPGGSTLIFAPDRSRGEFGFGRPQIIREGKSWKMWYGIRTLHSGYSMGYAESPDGKHWQRIDEAMDGFNHDGWAHDRRMRTFPSLVATSAGSLLFYNGNDYGMDGLCVAIRRTP